MANITLTQGRVPNWQGSQSGMTLRIFSVTTWIAADGTLFQAVENQYLELACTYSAPDFLIADGTIKSTRDAIINANATYRAVFYENGIERDEFQGFSSFPVPADPASQSWDTLAVFLRSIPPNLVDYEPYTKDQVNYLLGLSFNQTVITPGATTINVSGSLFFKTNNATPTTLILSNFTGDAKRHLVVIEFGDSVTNISGFVTAKIGDVFLGYWNGTALLPIAMFNS